MSKNIYIQVWVNEMFFKYAFRKGEEISKQSTQNEEVSSGDPPLNLAFTSESN